MDTSIAALSLLVVFLLCVVMNLSKRNDELKARQNIDTAYELKAGDRIHCRDRSDAINTLKVLKEQNVESRIDNYNGKYSIFIVR